MKTMRGFPGFSPFLLVFAVMLTAGCVGVDPIDAETQESGTKPIITHVFSTLNAATSSSNPILDSFIRTGISFALPDLDENVTGYVVELVWDADNIANRELALWVTDAEWWNTPGSGPPPFAAEGESPLRLAVPLPHGVEDRELRVFIRSAGEPVGVAYHQYWDAFVASFVDIPFDADWKRG